MAVPARPASGAPIDSAWGGIAHDTAVAQDIQTGQTAVSLSAANQGSTAVTFPRPFAGVPTVVAMVVSTAGGALSLIAQANVVSATGFTAQLSTGNGASVTIANVPIVWVAIGPRA